jgi:hypothetical protein
LALFLPECNAFAQTAAGWDHKIDIGLQYT